MTDYTVEILSYLNTQSAHADVRPLINVCILAEGDVHADAAKTELALQLAQLAEQRLIKFEACFLRSVMSGTQTPVLISITAKGKKQCKRNAPGRLTAPVARDTILQKCRYFIFGMR